eukprot:gnl/TRDRNA2_/TRDRNA2_152348_c0_seq3.p1 gnl/TRDRNA2_/TRDRNA2_152348_c0~~gnl/TRDRNA2_/TRDRNA2_152348_c0_seq3.p1  ORF type:complete len:172 (+),score=37.77 gnl/TRDRNA2_/TRDRNA2_152348_c0_seq3:1-516(+)
MIATDGDDAVLQMLSTNMNRNAPGCRVTKLFWGSAEPLATLGLKKQDLDFVLAADVVYGKDLEWGALVQTIKEIAGRDTLVVIANLHRYPVGHPKGEGIDGAFFQALLEDFDAKLLPQSLLQPTFRKHGAGSCLIHVLRKKKKRRRDENEELRSRRRKSRATTAHSGGTLC